MQIIHQAPLAALGLGAAFTVVWGVADPVAALAEVRVIEADGYYIGRGEGKGPGGCQAGSKRAGGAVRGRDDRGEER